MDDPRTRIAFHALLAAAFFFALQHLVLKESLQVSLVWAAAGGVAAAWLAWRQGKR